MAIEISGTTVIYNDAVIRVGSGTTAQRPASPVQGMVRYNTDLDSFEGFNGTNWGAIGGLYGSFYKANPTIVAFTKTGNFTVSTATNLYVEVNGIIKNIPASTAITMPGSAIVGTDYTIWCNPDGTLQATSDHITPPVTGGRKIGGFHYAPGGNATARSGGNATPQINQYSFWDIKFRPACPDPRGMTLVADLFWADIYLCGIDHIINGTSKYNVAYADGASPPKIPTKFGGTGSNSYSSFTWYEANEVLHSHGKRSPTYSQAAAYAYGTTEASSIGTEQNSTVWNSAYVSKWGVNQSTGVLWVWGDEFGGGTAAGWVANTGGRGSVYQQENASIFGGTFNATSNSGSRCANWSFAPSNSYYNIGARGLADHLILE